MNNGSKFKTRGHELSGPPLWRITIVRPATTAGLHVLRKYGVHPGVADLIARLAGLGSDREAM